jgi:transcriptional regulator with XRE-family HTH domain
MLFMLYLANILAKMNQYSSNPLPADVISQTAAKFIHLRKTGKLTQAKMADRSGVSLGSIKRFERTGKISLESFLKLLLILNRLEEFNSLLAPIDDISKVENLFSDRTRK